MRVCRHAAIVLALACWTWPWAGGPAFASDDHDAARSLLESGAVLPLEVILDIVEREYPGRLLEAELERDAGAWVYELEILTERGTVMELQYDAHSGLLRHAEQED